MRGIDVKLDNSPNPSNRLVFEKYTKKEKNGNFVTKIVVKALGTNNYNNQTYSIELGDITIDELKEITTMISIMMNDKKNENNGDNIIES